MEETDGFIGKVFKSGGGSLLVTIPQRNCTYSGIKEGDVIKIWYKKQPEIKEEED